MHEAVVRLGAGRFGTRACADLLNERLHAVSLVPSCERHRQERCSQDEQARRDEVPWAVPDRPMFFLHEASLRMCSLVLVHVREVT